LHFGNREGKIKEDDCLENHTASYQTSAMRRQWRHFSQTLGGLTRPLSTTLLQISEIIRKIGFFCRAMLCIRGTSHGPVSVCLSVSVSVTSRSSTKTAKRRITQTTPHDTPKTLVFWCQRSPRNSTGVTPYEGAECRWGGSKSATFD